MASLIMKLQGHQARWVRVLPHFTRASIAAMLLVLCSCGETGEKSSPAVEGTSALVELDTAGLRRFVAVGGPALLEFGGRRCISCRTMRRNLEALALEFPALRIGLVYWEDAPEALVAWRIGMIPAQVLLDGEGKVILRHIGVWSVEEMQDAVGRLVGDPSPRSD